MSTEPLTAKESITQYLALVEAVYGAVADVGFAQMFYVERLRSMGFGTIPGQRMFISPGDPNELERSGKWEQEIHHVAFATDVLARNSPGGFNQRLVGNMSLVYIYQMWEDEHRKRIANAIGIKDPNELRVPVLGDVRHYRRSIIHNKGIALPECARCEVLRWYDPGAEIFIDTNKLLEAKRAIGKALKGLVS